MLVGFISTLAALLLFDALICINVVLSPVGILPVSVVPAESAPPFCR